MDFETQFHTKFEELECLLTLMAHHGDTPLSGAMARQIGLNACDLIGEIKTAFREAVVS